MVAEADAVARAMGITLDLDIAADRRHQHASAAPAEHSAGPAGRSPMEIDALYRVPLDMARLAGVPTPTLDLLVSLIKVKARARPVRQPDTE